MELTDWTRPVSPLVFTRDARRSLALALLQSGDERLMPASTDEDASAILGALADLGLLELVPRGYVATDMLRSQGWALELTTDPLQD